LLNGKLRRKRILKTQAAENHLKTGRLNDCRATIGAGR
jgi:hypothetical protein